MNRKILVNIFLKLQPVLSLRLKMRSCVCVHLAVLLFFKVRDCTRHPLRSIPRTNGTQPNLRPRHCILYCTHYLNERNFAVILPPSNSHSWSPLVVAISVFPTLFVDYPTLKGMHNPEFPESFSFRSIIASYHHQTIFFNNNT